MPFQLPTHKHSHNSPRNKQAGRRVPVALNGDLVIDPERRLNLVNLLKEYFRVGLDELESFSKTQGVTIEFTKLAEARQFRGSESTRQKAVEARTAPVVIENAFPEELFAGIDEE